MKRLALCIAVGLSLAATAADKKAAAKPKSSMKAPDLGLGSVGTALPSGDGMQKPKDQGLGDAPKESAAEASYDVVKVQHAKGFVRSPNGSTPQGGELTEIGLSGNPPSTDAFTTIVRVHSKAKNNVPIEVAIVDPRGDTVMSSSGTVMLRGSKQDELDYQIDWEPTPLRSGGDYKVLVRLANEPKGTWPLKIVERAEKK